MNDTYKAWLSHVEEQFDYVKSMESCDMANKMVCQSCQYKGDCSAWNKGLFPVTISNCIFDDEIPF